MNEFFPADAAPAAKVTSLGGWLDLRARALVVPSATLTPGQIPSRRASSNIPALQPVVVSSPHPAEILMGDFFSFRKMITPTVIQIFFWLGVAGCVIAALVVLSTGDTLAGGSPIPPSVMAILILLVGPLLVRIYCELLMVLFRIYESLRNIERSKTS